VQRAVLLAEDILADSAHQCLIESGKNVKEILFVIRFFFGRFETEFPFFPSAWRVYFK